MYQLHTLSYHFELLYKLDIKCNFYRQMKSSIIRDIQLMVLQEQHLLLRYIFSFKNLGYNLLHIRHIHLLHLQLNLQNNCLLHK